MITENDICTAGLKNYYTNTNYYNEWPDLEMVKLCRQFIKEWLSPAPNCKRKISSYHLKHEVERWSGSYITNGAFILAAVLEGLHQEPTSLNSPNTWLCVKKNYNPYREQPRLDGVK
jgi:hypothetical protein